MYVRIRERPDEASSGNYRARIPPSNLWQEAGPLYQGLGQPAASVPACIPRPHWIPSLKHFFSPKIPMFLAPPPLRRKWYSTNSHDDLRPDRLNPGYIDSATHGLARDPNLDKKLKELIANIHAKNPPFDGDPFKEFVNRGGKIRVALVDLSTDLKLLSPKVAEFNSTRMTQGGSLAKVGLLYAAYQWLFDENVKNKGKGGTFNFTDAFHKALDGICNNCDASKVSRSIGLRYINSALWQSGLYDCRWGGIWLGAHYNEWLYKKNKWECDEDPYGYKGICTTEGCHQDPKGGYNIALNALSVATFFTLLAQGRLINDQSSQALKDILIMQPDRCGSRFREGLKEAGRFATTDRIYSKISVTSSLSHEGALIDRVSTGKKYAAVVLTISQAGSDGMVRQKLIEHLDKLIEMNP
jgi:hypothetical protein